ncbi:hypothetical protein ACLOBS_06700 [Limosilactobacillus mucosae]|uniref:hypothetical protein n=1 Tax=Limosilactobacillus mucosae TaxID=97478 RepID=UPI003EBA4C62
MLVYTYDKTDRLHPFTGAISVAEGTALTDGQTDVTPVNNNQFWNGTKWVGGDQLITAYHYDANGYWDGSVLIPDGAPLLTQETTVAPLDKDGRGMYKPKFDATQSKWVETLTQEEIDALNKPAPAKPTAEQQMISLLGQQVVQDNADNVQLKQDNVQLKQMVSVLGQTVAQLKAQPKTTN